MRELLPYRTRIQGTLNDGRIASALVRQPLEAIAAPALLIFLNGHEEEVRSRVSAFLGRHASAAAPEQR